MVQMLQRLRKVLQDGDKTKLEGTIEVDESFIGGKARNMHMSKRLKAMEKKNRGGKSIALGFLERGGRIRTTVVEDRERPHFRGTSATMSNRVQRSLPMNSTPIGDWTRITRIRSSTTLPNM